MADSQIKNETKTVATPTTNFNRAAQEIPYPGWVRKLKEKPLTLQERRELVPPEFRGFIPRLEK